MTKIFQLSKTALGEDAASQIMCGSDADFVGGVKGVKEKSSSRS